MHATPHVLSFPKTEIIATQIRTSHTDETNVETARLGKHWQHFLAGHSEQINHELPIFSVYTNYTGGHLGSYTNFIGQANSKLASGHTHSFTIPAGEYLVFTCTGIMPEALTKTWSFIWNFFENSTTYSRAFTTDFEVHYTNKPLEVLIYIAIK